MMEQVFDWLDAPLVRVAGEDVPMPYAANLEKLARPRPSRYRGRGQARLEPSEGRKPCRSMLMPALSPTMTEGNLAKWLKKRCDMIKVGDVIAEIETDKATMEVEAVDEGRPVRSRSPPAPKLAEGERHHAVILEEGEDAGAIKSGGAGGGAAAKSAAAKAPAAALAAAAAATGGGWSRPMSAAATQANAGGEAIAQEHGFDLSKILGPDRTGAWCERMSKGRRRRQLPPRPRCRETSGPGAGDLRYTGFRRAGIELVPHTSMRKTIARRLR